MVHERRVLPTHGEHEVQVGAHHAGLSDALLLDLRVSGLAEMVDQLVAGVDDHIVAVVGTRDHGAGIVIPESVDLVALDTVGLVLTGGEDIVGSVLERIEERAFVPASLGTHRVGEETSGIVVDVDQSGLGICIGLVEVVKGDDALLRVIEQALAARERHSGTGNSQSDKYLFHNVIQLGIRIRGSGRR